MRIFVYSAKRSETAPKRIPYSIRVVLPIMYHVRLVKHVLIVNTLSRSIASQRLRCNRYDKHGLP